jgi:hypothetical protein
LLETALPARDHPAHALESGPSTRPREANTGVDAKVNLRNIKD